MPQLVWGFLLGQTFLRCETGEVGADANESLAGACTEHDECMFTRRTIRSGAPGTCIFANLIAHSYA